MQNSENVNTEDTVGLSLSVVLSFNEPLMSGMDVLYTGAQCLARLCYINFYISHDLVVQYAKAVKEGQPFCWSFFVPFKF